MSVTKKVTRALEIRLPSAPWWITDSPLWKTVKKLSDSRFFLFLTDRCPRIHVIFPGHYHEGVDDPPRSYDYVVLYIYSVESVQGWRVTWCDYCAQMRASAPTKKKRKKKKQLSVCYNFHSSSCDSHCIIYLVICVFYYETYRHSRAAVLVTPRK